MQLENLRYETQDRVANVTLDRPDFRNAQSRPLLEELDAAFALAVADDDVRLIVLSAAI